MFVFRTKNLDHKFYENMVRRILYEFLTSKEMLQFLNNWTIEFHSLEKANTQFYEHVKLQEGQRINPNMPSGVTGQEQVLFAHKETLRHRQEPAEGRAPQEEGRRQAQGPGPGEVQAEEEDREERISLPPM